jgi:hypothetical protein
MKPLILLVILSVFLLFPTSALAQTSGIAVTPSILKIDLSEDSDEFILYYKNSTKEPVQLFFQAQDFTELEDGWKLKFLEPEDAKHYQYTLSSWIEFDRQTIDLNPYEERQIKGRIRKESLSPGAHYATILAEISPQKSQQGQVAIKGYLSSLVFVRTNTGQEIESARLSSLASLDRPFLSLPKGFAVRFQNTGNTELTPYGMLEIRDPFNRLIAKGILNDESLITLPESIRRYDLQLNQIAPTLFPGFYKTTLTINYGKSHLSLTENQSFFVLGDPLWISLCMILVVIGGSLFYRRRRRKKDKVTKR